MSILKIKNADGTWSSIPAIQGADGKDGAIQYTAGTNIKIENNVISAEIPESIEFEPDLYKLTERSTVYNTRKKSYSNLTNYKFGSPIIDTGWYEDGEWLIRDNLHLETEYIVDDSVCAIVKFELTSPVDVRIDVFYGMYASGLPANRNQVGIRAFGPEPNQVCTESEISNNSYLRFSEDSLDPDSYEGEPSPNSSQTLQIDLVANVPKILHIKFVKANTGGIPAVGWVRVPVEYLTGIETVDRLVTATDVRNMIQDAITEALGNLTQ